jgi:hypothetical protein
MKELLRAIAKIINTKFNNLIYLNNMEGITRPSFFIDFMSGINVDVNYAATEDNVLIQVVYFAPYLKGKMQDRINQSETIETLKIELNKQMMFKTDNYTAKIKQLNVGYTTDEDIYLQLQLEIYKLREFDQENAYSIENVSMNYKKN